MDPIDATEEATRQAQLVREDVERRRVESADSVDAAQRREAEISDRAALDSGHLAETESLLGVVMTHDVDETSALRRSLDLTDRPPTATPTTEEQVEQSASLRQAVVQPRDETADREAAPVDPTEQYEVHDAAAHGDRMAQAIERASRRTDVRSDDLRAETAQAPDPADRSSHDAGAAAATQFGAGRPQSKSSVPIARRDERRADRIDDVTPSAEIRSEDPRDRRG